MTSATGLAPKDVQLDATDRALVRALLDNARMTNQALADVVGIAPSTCLTRVRSLVDRGVIKGFHADVEPAAMGYALRAVIAVRLRPHARAGIGHFAERIAALPGVQHLYFLGGADDFLIDVAAADTDSLRTFVVQHLSENTDVAATETNLVFDFTRGGGL